MDAPEKAPIADTSRHAGALARKATDQLCHFWVSMKFLTCSVKVLS